jgi:hypothetical protein
VNLRLPEGDSLQNMTDFPIAEGLGQNIVTAKIQDFRPEIFIRQARGDNQRRPIGAYAIMVQ